MSKPFESIEDWRKKPAETEKKSETEEADAREQLAKTRIALASAYRELSDNIDKLGTFSDVSNERYVVTESKRPELEAKVNKLKKEEEELAKKLKSIEQSEQSELKLAA